MKKQHLTLAHLFDDTMYGKQMDMYVYIDSAKTLHEFAKNAKAEGFTFKDGSSISSKDGRHYYKILPDYTIEIVNKGWMFGMILENSTKVRKINYSKYMRGKICCNEVKIQRKMASIINGFKVLCDNITLQEKKDFYNWLINHNFLSWTFNFKEFATVEIDLDEKAFSLDKDYSEYSYIARRYFTIDEFKTIYNILQQ